MEKSGHMVLKGVNWVHNPEIRSNGLERSQTVYIMVKLGQMVLKESIGYTMQKSGHMVFKGVN